MFKRKTFIINILALGLSISVISGQDRSGGETEAFSVNNPFSFSLYASFNKWIEQYDTEKYIPAKIHYPGPSGDTLIKKVKLRSRGIYRKRNCEMPPIKIKFSDDDYGVELLDDLGAVKLVNYCKFNEIDEQYLVKEYLCYKIYETLTDYSFKTYFLQINFFNTDSAEESFTNYAFLVEDADDLAKRKDSDLLTTRHLPYEELNSYYEGLFALFQFMIGNTDIYLANQHNLKILREEGNLNSPPIIVPYDFDFCGLVNAHYASPGSNQRIKTVRDRKYLGSCRDDAELQELIQLFLEKKEDIMELISENMLLNSENQEDILDYIGEFYTIIKDEHLIKKNIKRKCWQYNKF